MSDSLARARLARAAAGMRKASALPRLVLMTDDARLADPLSAARALPRGSMVILRTRDAVERKRLASALRGIGRDLTLHIAGDAALAARADGLHLPESRMREAWHWRARFAAMTISVAVHSLRAVVSAQTLPIDAIFLSPIFTTASHPDGAVLMPLRAGLIARMSSVPVYALGGITSRNASRLAWDAFAGIAAIGALSPG